MRKLRLRHKQKVVVCVVSCMCFTLLVFLVKTRRSVLVPKFFEDDLKPTETNPHIPGSFLEGIQPSNTSYCSFRYDLPKRFNYKHTDVSYSPQLGESGSYRVLYNVIEGINSSKISVTYCTHLTPRFLYHVAEIVQNWEGAISVSAFVPDIDAQLTINMLQQLCHCLPGMERLSVHFVYPTNRPPRIEKEKVVNSCSIPETNGLNTYRDKENLPYPVNVCRNSARVAASTDYVLVSDVELIPSQNLTTRFIKMLKTFRNLNVLTNHIFVLPVFEVESSVEIIPRTKRELKKLYDEEKAVYFHRYVCSHCQKFPGLVKWLNKPSRAVVKPFIVVRREYPFHRWEPVYIGTNKDPFYSETLSWEGQQDKMTQVSYSNIKTFTTQNYW